MRTYEQAIDELDRLLATSKAMGRAVDPLNGKLQVKRWMIGRLCFEIFGRRATTKAGLSVAEFAKERGCSMPKIYDPLRVYRVLGDWYEQGSCVALYSDATLELLTLPRSAAYNPIRQPVPSARQSGSGIQDLEK